MLDFTLNNLNYDLYGANWSLVHFNMFGKITLNYMSIWFLLSNHDLKNKIVSLDQIKPWFTNPKPKTAVAVGHHLTISQLITIFGYNNNLIERLKLINKSKK